MKTNYFSKSVVLLSTATLLFACGEMEHMNLEHDFAEVQEVLIQVDEETFISADKATEIADMFFGKLTEGNVSTRSDSKAKRVSASVETLSERGNSLMYIINYPDGGFVIMGATKNYYPVLAYSDEGSFDTTTELGGAALWLEETKDAIKTSDVLNDTIKTKMQLLWKSYETADAISTQETQDMRLRSSSSAERACWNRCDELQMRYGKDGWNFLPLNQARRILDEAGFPGMYNDLCFGANTNNSPINGSIFAWKDIYKNEQVGPFIVTKWHQKTPFNDLCGGYSAGCGAVAAAQIMKYYHYPQDFNHNNSPFDWSIIPIDSTPGSAQAALFKHIGDYVKMNYGSNGSWTTPNNLRDGLRRFGYNVTKADHNHSTVERELFNYRRPLIMGGNSWNVPLPGPLDMIGGAHYWVCDGARRITTDQIQYFTEWQPNGNGAFTTGWNTMNSPGVLGGIGYLYFHMNWGWIGGRNNGWFAFNNINSGDGVYQYARQNFYITKP